MSQPEYRPDDPEGRVIIDTPPTHFVGFCDECLSAKVFSTERARDLWQRHHPHEVNA